MDIDKDTPAELIQEETAVEITETNQNLTADVNGSQPNEQESASLLATTANYLEYPRLICGSWKEFGSRNRDCFTKGCKWSPDGTCLLSCGDDNSLRFFDLPRQLYSTKRMDDSHDFYEISPSLKISEGELIYDYCWYPLMSSWNPETCLLASTARNGPVHLWDAYTGKLAASYRAYNSVDEVESAYSICISPGGEKLYCGFNKTIRVFDLNCPGRNCETRSTKIKKSASVNQPGIISCITVNPALPSIYCAASYLKTIALGFFHLGVYSEPDGQTLCVLQGHRGGVTHLRFSHDGTLLFSGGRKDPEILCWDLRNPGQVLFTMKRNVQTNQRIYFDLNPTGRFLVSGDTTGHVLTWDITSAPGEDGILVPVSSFRLNEDCTNGIACHQWLPIIATSSGQRHIPQVAEEESSGEDDEPLLIRSPYGENSVKLWWAGENCTREDGFANLHTNTSESSAVLSQ
nr:EOG090X06W9 [Eulimnadia texana]